MSRPTETTMRGELVATGRLAAPLAAASFLQMAVHAIDVMFVSRLGTEALAAASLGISYYWLVSYGWMGVVGAVAPFASAEMGRRSNPVREVRRAMRMAMWIAILSGAVSLALAALGGWFFRVTGQDPRIADAATGFLVIISFSMVPAMLSTVLRIFVSIMGRPVFATIITALAIGVNALGNYVLIFGKFGAPALGLNGSALASVITACITFLAYVVAIQTNRRMRRYRLFGNFWRPEWRRLKDIVRIGTPIGLTLMAEGGLFTGAAFLMGRIGAAELAAHSIALQISSFSFQVAYGASQAGTIRVGMAYGARDAAAIARAGRAALIIGVGFMCLSAIGFLLFPRALLSIYVDVDAPGNAALVAFGLQFLLVAAAFQLFDGTQAVCAGLLRGLQDTRVPMVIAIGGYWMVGFVAASWLGLATPLGGLGVWIGLAAGLVVVASALLTRWTRRAAHRLLPEPLGEPAPA